jgi:hypothetical protein
MTESADKSVIAARAVIVKDFEMLASWLKYVRHEAHFLSVGKSYFVSGRYA